MSSRFWGYRRENGRVGIRSPHRKQRAGWYGKGEAWSKGKGKNAAETAPNVDSS